MMELKLEQVTPEKIRELCEERAEQRLESLVRAEVIALAEEFQIAKQFAEEMQARCQIRAFKLSNLGYGKAELAELFDVPARTVGDWLKQDIAVTVRGDV